jgi:hypothetical protein
MLRPRRRDVGARPLGVVGPGVEPGLPAPLRGGAPGGPVVLVPCVHSRPAPVSFAALTTATVM